MQLSGRTALVAAVQASGRWSPPTWLRRLSRRRPRGRGGPVDILVANVGPFGEHTIDEATDEDFRGAFGTNVLSVVRCVRGQ